MGVRANGSSDAARWALRKRRISAFGSTMLARVSSSSSTRARSSPRYTSWRRCSLRRSNTRHSSFSAATAVSKPRRSVSSRSGHTFSNATYRTLALAPLDPDEALEAEC
eukprot:3609314-Pleurochrysis_carterae.AAC.1